MYEGDRDGPFAHCRRHALDIASPDITHREHAGQTRFEKMGNSGERPMRGGQILRRKIRSRLNESFSIEGNTSLEPLRTGNCPCHEENVLYLVGLDVAGLMVAPAHAF